MVEGDVLVYNCFKTGILKGTYNLATGGHVFRMTLHTADYEPDIDTHSQRSDVVASEYDTIPGSGYARDGKTLFNQSVYLDGTKDSGVFDADDMTWSILGLGDDPPGWAILWDDTPDGGPPPAEGEEAPPIDPLVAVWKLGSTRATGGSYTLAWSPNGIIVLA